jgi:hypothetical protein
MSDIKEQEMSVKIIELLGKSSILEVKQKINPETLCDYIVLDSKYRDLSEDQKGYFQKLRWKYSPTINIVDNFINSYSEIKNINSMRLLNPTINVVDLGLTENCLSILIEEFGAQSFKFNNLRRSHWLFQTRSAPNYDLIIKSKEDCIFDFRMPISSFDTLTVTLGNPINQITLPPDRAHFTIIPNFPTSFQTVLVTEYPHGLTLGSVVNILIEGFNTTDPVADKLIIDEFNSKYVINVTFVSGIDTIIVDIPTSTLSGILSGSPIVYFTDRRIILPLEITYLKNLHEY